MEEKEVDLDQYVGQDPDDVRRQLEDQDVLVDEVYRPVPAPLALLYQVQANSRAWPGSYVRIMTVGRTVVGFEVEPPVAVMQTLAEVRRWLRSSRQAAEAKRG
jgi:hypothetical protein